MAISFQGPIGSQDHRGTLAQRPPAGIRGRFYFVTNDQLWYLDNGQDWTPWLTIAPLPMQTIEAFGQVAGTVSTQAAIDNLVAYVNALTATLQAIAAIRP